MNEDNLEFNNILPYLKTKYVGRTYAYYENIDSTNTEAKRLIRTKENIENGSIIISETQYSGVGKLNRAWYSPPKVGLWFSIILNLNSIKAEISKITLLAGAAVCSALRNLNINAEIKWPNDIYLNDEKLGGILCERVFSKAKNDYVIIGIGLNVNTREENFPEELKDYATSIFIQQGIEFSRIKILCEILNTFENYINTLNESHSYNEIIGINRLYSNVLNKAIKVIQPNNSSYKAFVLDLSDNGELITIDQKGNVNYLISNEVSIRIN